MDNSEYLMHYGRKGMKWGEHIFSKSKNKQSTKSNSEIDIKKKKESIIKSRSAKQLYKNADLFTVQELQDAYIRLALERKIKDIDTKNVTKGQQFIDRFNTTSGNINKITSSVANVYKTTNNIRDIYNKKH